MLIRLPLAGLSYRQRNLPSAAATRRRELHVLPLPLEVEGDDRRVSRPGAAGHLALPDRLAGRLVEGHEGRVLTAGRADQPVAVHERRFAVTPHRGAAAKVARQAALPDDLAVPGLEAGQFAAHPQDVNPVAVHRRRTSRAFLRLRHALPGDRPEGCRPQFLAVRLGQGPEDLTTSPTAHAEDPPAGDGRGAVAAAEPRGLLGERRAANSVPHFGECPHALDSRHLVCSSNEG
jgi:hypothetical protein